MALPISPRKKGAFGAMFPKGPAAPPVTAMHLQSPHYSSKILGGLDELRKQKLLCDYTLVADNIQIGVHRAVLVASSDYFRAMLTGEMRESREVTVTLQGVSAAGLQAIVDFAYTGSLTLTLENLEEVLSAASHLQVAEAMDLCCQFIQSAVTVSNCVDILNLAELYSLGKTRLYVTNFVLDNFEALADCEQYNKLNVQQMVSLLEKNSLKVLSEYKLFELVLKWIEADSDARMRHVAILMRHIRLPLLSGEELVDKVSRVSVMQENKACRNLLTDAKDYHIVVSKQPMLQTPRTQVRSNKQSLVTCHAENLESYDIFTEHHTFMKDAPVPLYNPCVCVIDNFMYACGGKYDSNENNEIATARCFRYDPRFDTWYELPSMNEARKDFVTVAYKKSIYAIAGQDENSVMNTCEKFYIEKNDWESSAALPLEVFGHAGGLCKGRIYVAGGVKFDGHCSAFSSFDPITSTWQVEAPLLQPRSNHSMQEIHGKLYVHGGNVEDSYGFPIPVTAIEYFDPETGDWNSCKATVNIREAGTCTLHEKIYIVGGINGDHYYSELIQCFEPDKDKVEVVDMYPSRIYGRACSVLTLPQYV